MSTKITLPIQHPSAYLWAFKRSQTTRIKIPICMQMSRRTIQKDPIPKNTKVFIALRLLRVAAFEAAPSSSLIFCSLDNEERAMIH